MVKVLIQTFHSEKNQRVINFKNNKGLSLIEILVALTLASTVLIVSVGNPLRDDRDFLEDSVSTVERAIRAGYDESVLRNKITRLKIDLTKARPELSLQYAVESTFVLPDLSEFDKKGLSISDREELAKKQKKLDSNFEEVTDIDGLSDGIHENVKIIGVQVAQAENPVVDAQASIYFYPSGERDNALLLLGSPEEIIALTVDPFSGKIKRQYVTIDQSQELEDEYERIMDEISENYVRE